MTYKINGTVLTLQPTVGRWLPRRELGLDGNNRSIYAPTYMFELGWDIMSIEEFDQLRDFWMAVSASGSVSAELPQKDAAAWVFAVYTGVVPDEPEPGEYSFQYIMRCRWRLRNIVI